MRRLILAAVLYGVLLAASLATLTDWRIRLATVAVICMFAARTLWQPRRPEREEPPWGRPADTDHGP
ncbi:MAG TPA: hypothetical protein VN515_10580 [Terriglobales bacterium]|nr:hypothetical protein [Terriglobales bacterium]